MEAMLNQTAPDVEAVDEFAARLIAMINDGAATIMVSLGHRSGLFDTMASLPPSTVETIAEVAELSERYVKEWLGAMTTAGIVGYDQERRTYCLPTAHAALLSRAAAPNNIAVTSQFVGVAAAVEEQMLGRLKDGGGTCYSDYTRFHEVMAEDSNQTVVLPLVEEILPIVPGLIERLTAGIEVVDIGCGAGSALMRLAAEFPQSSFTGIDLCHDAFIETQVLALKKRLDNIQFIAADVSEYDSLGEFDLITAFDAIHDQKDPLGALRTVKASLASDGVFPMQDIGGSRDVSQNINNPFAPLLYTISLMHCMPVSIGQGGPGLGAMWGVETAEEYLALAGFTSVDMHRLAHDPVNAYWVVKQ